MSLNARCLRSTVITSGEKRCESEGVESGACVRRAASRCQHSRASASVQLGTLALSNSALSSLAFWGRALGSFSRQRSKICSSSGGSGGYSKSTGCRPPRSRGCLAHPRNALGQWENYFPLGCMDLGPVPSFRESCCDYGRICSSA